MVVIVGNDEDVNGDDNGKRRSWSKTDNLVEDVISLSLSSRANFCLVAFVSSPDKGSPAIKKTVKKGDIVAFI